MLLPIGVTAPIPVLTTRWKYGILA